MLNVAMFSMTVKQWREANVWKKFVVFINTCRFHIAKLLTQHAPKLAVILRQIRKIWNRKSKKDWSGFRNREYNDLSCKTFNPYFLIDIQSIIFFYSLKQVMIQKRANHTYSPYFALSQKNTLLLYKHSIFLFSCYFFLSQFQQLTYINLITLDFSLLNYCNAGSIDSLVEALEKQDLWVNSMLAQLECKILWNMFRNVLVTTFYSSIIFITKRQSEILKIDFWKE